MNQTLSPLYPSLLIDPTSSQLQEIYTLRVKAWSTNPLFDSKRFPTGLFDTFDERSLHWVISEEERIIAAARLTVGRQLNELPDHNVFNQVQLPAATPIALLSRLVIHPMFRSQGLAQAFDHQRLRGLATQYWTNL